jgi:hypothetical protein
MAPAQRDGTMRVRLSLLDAKVDMGGARGSWFAISAERARCVMDEYGE